MVDTLVILIICSVTLTIIYLILRYFKSEIIYLAEIENQDKEERQVSGNLAIGISRR